MPVAARSICLVRTSGPRTSRVRRTTMNWESVYILYTQMVLVLKSGRSRHRRGNSLDLYLLWGVELEPVGRSSTMTDVPTEGKHLHQPELSKWILDWSLTVVRLKLRELELGRGPQTQIFLEVRHIMNGRKNSASTFRNNKLQSVHTVQRRGSHWASLPLAAWGCACRVLSELSNLPEYFKT